MRSVAIPLAMALYAKSVYENSGTKRDGRLCETVVSIGIADLIKIQSYKRGSIVTNIGKPDALYLVIRMGDYRGWLDYAPPYTKRALKTTDSSIHIARYENFTLVGSTEFGMWIEPRVSQIETIQMGDTIHVQWY